METYIIVDNGIFDSVGEESELLVFILVVILVVALFIALRGPAPDSKISGQVQYDSRSGSLSLIFVIVLCIVGVFAMMLFSQFLSQYSFDTLLKALAGSL